MKKKILGLDFGTSNTLISTSAENKIIYNEPSVLAVDNDNNKVVEIGYLAHKLIGKSPRGINIEHPIHDGVIADKELAYAYLNTALDNTNLDGYIKRAGVICAVPYDITKVEKRALYDVISDLKASSFYMANSSLLSAIGSSIDIFTTRGNMIIDIGGSKTTIATMTMGRIVVEDSIYEGGNYIDRAIARYVRTKHHLLIGDKTAEYIKMKIGTLLDTFDNNLLEVNGKDLQTFLPRSIIISTAEINTVITDIYKDVVNLAIDVMELSPAEISSDIIHSGITITGGGCLINGTREYFQKKLSVPIHISAYPLESTIRGIIQAQDRILEDPNALL